MLFSMRSKRQRSTSKATFILVHGSWHWGGCFLKLANALALRGHSVMMPDLATHGYDTTPIGKVVDMAQYTASVRHILENTSAPAILVGHSMGGATCDYLGELMPERIRALVYLAGFMCRNGSCPNDYILFDWNQKRGLIGLVSIEPMGVRLVLDDLAKIKMAFYHDCSDHDVEIAARSVIPLTPSTPNTALSATTAQRFGRLRRIYIECTNDRALSLEAQRKMQQDVPGAKVVTMQTSHSPFFSQPDSLAEILNSLT
jgi:pimeloyl-ACP methyl ester carboxylesterase